MNITDQYSLTSMSEATRSNIVAIERVSHTIKNEVLRDFYVGYSLTDGMIGRYLMVQDYLDKNKFKSPLNEDFYINGVDSEPVNVFAKHKLIEKAHEQRRKRGEKVT